MERTFFRQRFLSVQLLVFVVFLVSCGHEAPAQAPRQLGQIPQQFVPTVAATSTPTHTIPPQNTPFTPAGAAVWILSCLDGWQKQQIYQSNPYYVNQAGVKKARDIYVFGHFWLQPRSGELWSYHDQPEMLNCLSQLIVTVHAQYHGRVCGVISVDETPGPGGWKPADVVAYTKRAVTNPALLTPLIAQVRKYPYDCLINDIEDGDRTHPEIFSRYDALLKSKLPVPLGQTLIWKTPAVSSYWQKWEDWQALAGNADFFIVMALDHDALNTPPVPTSVVDNPWVKDIYAYMRSIPHLFSARPIAWELPTYYRLFTQQRDGGWVVSSGTDTATQVATALKSTGIIQAAEQDPDNPYIKYVNAQGQTTYLFFETARSSDVLAQTLTTSNQATCLSLSFWDNDSGTSGSLGWSEILADKNVRLC